MDREGSVRLEDSHVLLITADYLDIDPVVTAVPELGKALRPWSCSGVFCGLPSYLPLMKYLKSVPQTLCNGAKLECLYSALMQSVLVSACTSY